MIVIYAPFPSPERVRGGWMGRIAAIERLFASRERVYVYPGDPAFAGDPFDYRVHVAEVAPGARFSWLDLRLSNHHRWLTDRIDEAEFVYAHTSHSSHHLLPYYRTGKVVTDLHGIAPEEEELQGHPDRARFFGGLEEDMVRGSAALVTVTEAMYPGLTTPMITLPIIEAPPADVDLGRPDRARPVVVYSGGVQSWQNVDLMLSTIASCRDRFEFRLYTDAVPAMRAAAERHGLGDGLPIATVPPAELPRVYADADYGFVLRDDIAVNRVSCPTKLSEYLAYGVVPIVLHDGLGDFASLGYRRVLLADFTAGRLPAAAELRATRQRNLEVFRAIRAQFEAGSRRLQELTVAAPVQPMRARAGLWLTGSERAAFYPVRGSRIEVERGDGRHVVAWPEEVEARIERTFALPGSGPVREVELVLPFPPFLLAPVQAELVDAAGAALPLSWRGNHDVDRHGNWLFQDAGPHLRAEPGAPFDAVSLRVRSEYLLVGPEALLAAKQLPLRWSDRVVAALRRRVRRR
jgi:hypothetical protein